MEAVALRMKIREVALSVNQIGEYISMNKTKVMRYILMTILSISMIASYLVRTGKIQKIFSDSKEMNNEITYEEYMELDMEDMFAYQIKDIGNPVSVFYNPSLQEEPSVLTFNIKNYEITKKISDELLYVFDEENYVTCLTAYSVDTKNIMIGNNEILNDYSIMKIYMSIKSNKDSNFHGAQLYLLKLDEELICDNEDILYGIIVDNDKYTYLKTDFTTMKLVPDGNNIHRWIRLDEGETEVEMIYIYPDEYFNNIDDICVATDGFRYINNSENMKMSNEEFCIRLE